MARGDGRNAAEVRVAIIAYPGASAFSVYGPFDEFRGAERLWPYYQGDTRTAGPFRPDILTVDDEPAPSSGGATITPTAAIADRAAYDIVHIPSLFCDARLKQGRPRAAGDGPRFPEATTAWIAGQWEKGAVVSAMCTGVFVMAETGLLAGRPATTHWAFADLLQAENPDIEVRPNEPMVATGPGDRIVTGGAAAYSSNVTLYLMSRFSSPEAAHDYARATGFFCNTSSPNLIARHLGATEIADGAVSDAIAWFADHLDAEHPVAAAAERLHLTEKTFARRFRQATGHAPLKYLQRMRIETARGLLEKGRAPVDEIAARVGYQDPGAFRRVFKRETGLSPAEYRRSFKLPAAG